MRLPTFYRHFLSRVQVTNIYYNPKTTYIYIYNVHILLNRRYKNKQHLFKILKAIGAKRKSTNWRLCKDFFFRRFLLMLNWTRKDALLACKRCPFEVILTPF